MTLPGLNVPAITGVCCALMLSAPFAQTSSKVEHVVEQMRGMSMTIQGAGRMTEREVNRRAITKQLHDLGPSAIFALARVLRDSDVQMRQNAALVLSSLGGGYEEQLKPPLDDARLEREYPGGGQRRPGSLDFVVFSAVGFNKDKTKALVYVETRSSFQTELMERRADKWEASKEGVRCGGIA